MVKKAKAKQDDAKPEDKPKKVSPAVSKKRKSPPRLSIYARQWCYTWNNYTEEDYARMKAWCEQYCTWWAMGREEGDKEKTPHIQGAFRTKNTRTFKNLKGVFPDVHFEIMKASCKRNDEYCTKDGKFEVGGKLPSQGKRTDLDDLKDAIKDGVSLDDITMKRPTLYHQYGRTLEKVELICLRKKWRTEMTEGIWYWGETASGKSHRAFENFHPDTHYLVALNDKGWWEGYKGQETVILNDFRGEMRYNELLQLIDKWPYDVKLRNKGKLPFISKRVIITSSLPPHKCFPNRQEEDDIAQLLRRIKVIELKRDENPVENFDEKVSGRSGEGVILSPSPLMPSSPNGARSSDCTCDGTFCECI